MNTADDIIGSVLGGYRVLGLIDTGGMSAVYAAENDAGRVAIKVLRPEWLADELATAAFRAEARLAGTISHPNVIKIIETAQSLDGCLYFVMEYLDGENLRQFARSRFPLSPELVATILTQVCAGLAAAHSHGIVHRDVKPSNIVVSERIDDSVVAKVVDFGAAVRAGTADDEAGTTLYMAPEQARCLPTVDGRADVYSVGCIVYELFTGRVPYPAHDRAALLEAQARGLAYRPKEICRELPSAWDSLIVEAIALEPGARVQSASVLAARMVAVSSGQGG